MSQAGTPFGDEKHALDIDRGGGWDISKAVLFYFPQTFATWPTLAFELKFLLPLR